MILVAIVIGGIIWLVNSKGNSTPEETAQTFLENVEEKNFNNVSDVYKPGQAEKDLAKKNNNAVLDVFGDIIVFANDKPWKNAKVEIKGKNATITASGPMGDITVNLQMEKGDDGWTVVHFTYHLSANLMNRIKTNKPLQQKISTIAPAATVTLTPANHPGVADYSKLLTVADVQSITGLSNLTLKSIDSKKSGEANDLTFSTADGKTILGIQVLNGSDYDMYYKQYCAQDYKAMEYAFWGPKTATPTTPPSQLWFRKGDTLIFIDNGYNGNKLDVGMMEKMAKLIASRL